MLWPGRSSGSAWSGQPHRAVIDPLPHPSHKGWVRGDAGRVAGRTRTHEMEEYGKM